MKVKLQDLVNSADVPSQAPGQPSTPGALSRFIQVEMRIKEGFRLKGILKQVNEYLSRYSEARRDLFVKHGTHDENAGTYDLKTPEQQMAFAAEYNELLSTEVEIAGERFRLANFFSHSKMTAADLITLEWLIDDEAGDAGPLTLVKQNNPAENDDLLELADAKAA